MHFPFFKILLPTKVKPTVKGEIIMMHLSGNTSLHWTSRKGHESVVRALVELGADIHAKDNE